MEKTLFAVDELSGFVLAVAYVRPEGLVGMTPKSVKKKMKQPSFAAAVNRDELRQGAEELGVDFDEHLRLRDRGAGRAPRRAAAGSRGVGHGVGRVAMAAAVRIVVLEGDETGQELLEQSLRVLDPGLLGLEFELAPLRPVARAPARDRQPGRDRRGRGDARGRPGAQGGDDHARGRRRRRLPQPDPARAGRRQGDRPDRPPAAGRGSDRRRPLPDLGGADGGRRRLRRRGVARGRPGRRGRGRLPDASGSPARPAGRWPSTRSGPPPGWARGSTAAPSGPSRRCTRGCSRRRWTPPRRGIPRSTTGRC